MNQHTSTKVEDAATTHAVPNPNIVTGAIVPVNAMPPAELLTELQETAGLGESHDHRDIVIPLIYVLQPLSPQLEDGSDKYIKGAKPGDIWLRGDSDELVHQDERFWFQPCCFYKEWLEWVPRERGGGFVGRYAGDEDHPPEGARPVGDKLIGGKPVMYEIGDGNQLKFARVHGGFVIRKNGSVTPYMISLTSTGHVVSREFMRLIKNVPPVPNVGRPPSWVKAYEVGVKKRKNVHGVWFVLTFKDIGERGYLWHDPAAMARGRQMFEAWKSGAISADVPDDQAGEQGSTYEHAGADDSI